MLASPPLSLPDIGDRDINRRQGELVGRIGIESRPTKLIAFRFPAFPPPIPPLSHQSAGLNGRRRPSGRGAGGIISNWHESVAPPPNIAGGGK